MHRPSGANLERPVTIAVAGTHSTGKSALVARMAHDMRRENLEVATVADLGEHALRRGLPNRHAHDYASTLWIMAAGISAEVETWPHVDVLLVDRPVPDALGCYLAALEHRNERPDSTLVGHLRTIAAQHAIHYDLVYRTTLGLERVREEVVRPRDHEDYRRLADQHVARVLVDLGISYQALAATDHETVLQDAISFAIAHIR